MSTKTPETLKIGWASTDLTPDQPVNLLGQFHARVSEGVRDPLTATVLALESGGEETLVATILISCDIIGIPDGLRDRVRSAVRLEHPELEDACILLNATHTHTGPTLPTGRDAFREDGNPLGRTGVDLPVMDEADYLAFAVDRISGAAVEAWKDRRPGSIGYGLGHAVVGYNRRLAYSGGESRMYGKADDPQFSHVEGYEDHSVNLLGTWDSDGKLTGLVINLACPSQVSEHEFQVSADYWHETRQELRKRLGDGLFVLPQCAPAGDQSPRPMINKTAEERMRRLMERNMREDIAVRIADAVDGILPYIAKDLNRNPALRHQTEVVNLSRRLLSEADVEEAKTEAQSWREKYNRMRDEIEANPEKRKEARWYVPITIAFRRMRWYEGVLHRHQSEQSQPRIPVEVQVLRVGDVAFVTSPFELYLDFGIQIRGRSKAPQTFTVQLAGAGTYLPTFRAVAGGSYGAVPASTPVGPEGGRELVEHSLQMIESLWSDE